ncbi:hypothetical protein HRbin33_01686 [bacterium HR33]|nr:hypothetical protein HRbin33_01686 [bacterium HR33]
MFGRVTAAMLFLAALYAAAAHAQEVRGRLVDRSTGAAVRFGFVVLVDARGTEVGRTSPDAGGGFRLRAPEPGRGYRVRVEIPGYRLYISEPLDLEAGEVREVALELVPIPPVEMDTVIVAGQAVPRRLAEFYRRRAGGFGSFLTREEFERYSPREVSDVIRRMPGFGVVPGDLGTGGVVVARRPAGFSLQCFPIVYVDGTYVGNSREFDIDSYLDVQTIEAVESYSGGAQVPPEFNRSGAECGVIALWTRTGTVAQGRSRRLELGGQFGLRIASGGLRDGRFGASFAVAVSRAVELYPSFGLVAHVPNTDFNTGASGWQFTFAFRARPLGLDSPWYAGLGLTTLNIKDLGGDPVAGDESTQHLVFLTGAAMPVGGRLRPYLELQLLDPFTFSRSQVHAFLGLVYRIY